MRVDFPHPLTVKVGPEQRSGDRKFGPGHLWPGNWLPYRRRWRAIVANLMEKLKGMV
jgi:hypothetical protein